MTKAKKITFCIILAVILLFVLGYAYLCHMSAKPGISGVNTINGMIRLVLSDNDYVKVGDDRYLFKNGKLDELIKAEYDSYDIDKKIQFDPIESLDTQMIMYGVTVTRGADNYRPVGVTVWSSIFSDKYHSVYFKSIN